LAAFIAIAAAYAFSVWMVVQRIDRRLERIEERLGGVEQILARIEQRLDDHISNHPGPTQRLTSSR
jgi:Flp pilus assembly protein TadB